MAEKRYYWLKLKEDFFSDKKIKKLRRVAGGDTYTIIYLKMLLKSIKSEGYIIYEGIEESLEEEVALDIDEDVENVKMTIAFLQANNLIQETTEGKFALPETLENLGSETASANRVRKHREEKKSQKALQCNTDVTQLLRKCNVEKDIDIDIDIDIDKSENKESATLVAPLSQEEIDILFEEFWVTYPKRINKSECRKVYSAIKNLYEEHQKILEDIKRRKGTTQWQVENYRYVFNPLNYLKDKHWLDDFEQTNNKADETPNGGFEEL